jgi:hypothetical protein
MSWNGSGVYSLPALYFPEAPGNLVDSTRYNGTLNDISTGLNNALAKDGQNSATGNLPMSGFKHTGASNATVTGEYLVYGQTLLAASGTLAAPGFAFASDTNTGLWRNNADEMQLVTGGVARVSLDAGGNTIVSTTATPPTLATNNDMVFNLTTNTNLRISVRGSDGITRVANITLT